MCSLQDGSLSWQWSLKTGYTISLVYIFALGLLIYDSLIHVATFSFSLSQAPQCEHAFCSACIHEWLTRQPTCPVDRNPITPNQLKPVPRILRNLLSRLMISCDNASHGCPAVVKLDMLQAHIQVHTHCQIRTDR